MFGEIGEKKTFGEFYIGDSIAISDHLLFIINYDVRVQTLPRPPYFI